MNLALWLVLSAAVLSREPEDSSELRDMVERQLRGLGILDARVLSAMRKVPRHEFVPPELRRLACSDGTLPIGHGQTISQPYIVGLMTELLKVESGSRVLEVGTGSGYQAAVLAELASDVYSIEIVASLALQARETLDRLGYRNVHTKVGDGYLGWPEEAPFDAIIVTCAPDDVPQALIDQLKERGRLVVPVGDSGDVQELFLLEKIDGRIRRRCVAPVRFVPMTH
ncbi:MAG: protein-L-isoaspartate(D-aspartate) O-methyltransferase [Verrucomicrobiota bacterium]